MLTQLQRDAMSRAQAGDFSLADAIELLHPYHQSFRDEPLVGGIAQGGRLQLLVYGEDCVCDNCDDGQRLCDDCGGCGTTECESCRHVSPCKSCADGKVECDMCSGDPVLCADPEDARYIVNLNGDVLYDSQTGDTSGVPPLEVTYTTKRAKVVVAAYENEGTTPVDESQQAALDIGEALAA